MWCSKELQNVHMTRGITLDNANFILITSPCSLRKAKEFEDLNSDNWKRFFISQPSVVFYLIIPVKVYENIKPTISPVKVALLSHIFLKNTYVCSKKCSNHFHVSFDVLSNVTFSPLVNISPNLSKSGIKNENMKKIL